MIRLPILKDELAFLEKHLPQLEGRADLGQLATEFKNRIAQIRREISALERDQNWAINYLTHPRLFAKVRSWRTSPCANQRVCKKQSSTSRILITASTIWRSDAGLMAK